MYYGDVLAVDDVTMDIPEHSVTALIGPSGCGKSTFLRSLNRMHEVIAGARVSGDIRIGGADIYARGIDPVLVRRKVGMVFQKANPFPTMSIADNVLTGVRLNSRRLTRAQAEEIVETSLRSANLWDEVKDRLNRPGSALSGGQQQRLCIARAVAVKPEVLLMDEPCSALDPVSTLAIEELMAELAEDYTIVIVTHNMQQARRVSQQTAFFSISGPSQPGRLIEYGPTSRVFEHPENESTANYVAGRFG
nr:phosphate ABC transporter ATP-binding protein PstB [Nanchangia anserum]